MHCQLAMLLLGLGKVEYHGREHVIEQSCSPHGGQKVERQRLSSLYPLEEHNPNDLISFYWTPHPKMFYHFPIGDEF